MKLRNSALLLWIVFCLNTNPARAAQGYSVRGIVITPDGTVVPAFVLIVRRVSDKPELVKRSHFKNGEFSVDGLETGKYKVEISAPLYIPVRTEIAFKPGGKETDSSIVILHHYRNEPRFMPAYSVSVKALQQKVPDSAREAYSTAVKLHREGELEKALIEYGKAIRFYPKYLQALTDAATILILYNQPAPALAFLRRAQEIDGSNPIVNMNIAITMAAQDDYSGALKLLRNVLRVDPRIALPHYYIAHIYFRQQKYAEAEKAAREAISKDPNLLEAWVLLMKANEELNDFAAVRDALMHLRNAIGNKRISRFIDEQLSRLEPAGS